MRPCRRHLPLLALALTGWALLPGCKRSGEQAAEQAAAPEQAKAPQQTAAAEPATAGPAAAIEPTRHPFLWRIDGPKPSWLYGTIHVPDPRVLALPAAVTRALDGCDAFYAEIPLDAATQVQMTPLMMLPTGKKLADVLPQPLYERLAKLFASKGLPLAALDRLKVWAIATQLPLLDHLMEFATRQPLDMVLYKRAEQAGKPVGGLETPQEQIDVFDGLSQAEQVRMLEQTLDQIDEFAAKGRDPIAHLVDAYLAGDPKKMLATMLETYDPTNELDRKMMKRLFTDRNRRMTARIAAKLESAPARCYFFAVGAGHLLGDEGLVAMLRAKGFKLERTTTAPAEK